MIKPNILVEVIDGQPKVSVITLDADKALDAYKASEAEAYLFIRPAATKRKNALKTTASTAKTAKRK